MSASVPKVCPGGTVVCLASGPSLTADDVAVARRADAVVAINTTYQMAPWATVLYAADAPWWTWHHGVPTFAGLKYSLSADAARWGVHILKKTGVDGLETNPDGLRTGQNSGYQAINMAVHLGAARVLLLGYDMQLGPKRESHWHGDHPSTVVSPFASFLPHFSTLIQPLADLGIAVINCTRRTALRCFPMMPITDVLQ